MILLTALLNARHLLYSAALAPWLRGVPRLRRAVMAHLLTDEAFALSIAHFERIGRPDERGYWIAAIMSTFIPWNMATLAGVTVGAQIPDPAVSASTWSFRRRWSAWRSGWSPAGASSWPRCGGAILGVAVSLAAGPGIGVIVGGIGGACSGCWSRDARRRRDGLGTTRSAERYAMPGAIRPDGPRGPPHRAAGEDGVP